MKTKTWKRIIGRVPDIRDGIIWLFLLANMLEPREGQWFDGTLTAVAFWLQSLALITYFVLAVLRAAMARLRREYA